MRRDFLLVMVRPLQIPIDQCSYWLCVLIKREVGIECKWKSILRDIEHAQNMILWPKFDSVCNRFGIHYLKSNKWVLIQFLTLIENDTYIFILLVDCIYVSDHNYWSMQSENGRDMTHSWQKPFTNTKCIKSKLATQNNHHILLLQNVYGPTERNGILRLSGYQWREVQSCPSPDWQQEIQEGNRRVTLRCVF